MEHIINAKNTTVTPSIKSYIEKKFEKFEKYVNGENITVYTKIEIKDNGHRHKVEVTIPIEKNTIRAEVNDTDMYAAIDNIEKIVSRMLRKRKEKLTDKYQSTGKAPELDEERYHEYDISRVKTHKLSSMSAQEACEAMEMLSHPFYGYFDIDYGKPCVVYQREDGTYGQLVFE